MNKNEDSLERKTLINIMNYIDNKGEQLDG